MIKVYFNKDSSLKTWLMHQLKKETRNCKGPEDFTIHLLFSQTNTRLLLCPHHTSSDERMSLSYNKPLHWSVLLSIVSSVWQCFTGAMSITVLWGGVWAQILRVSSSPHVLPWPFHLLSCSPPKTCPFPCSLARSPAAHTLSGTHCLCTLPLTAVGCEQRCWEGPKRRKQVCRQGSGGNGTLWKPSTAALLQVLLQSPCSGFLGNFPALRSFNWRCWVWAWDFLQANHAETVSLQSCSTTPAPSLLPGPIQGTRINLSSPRQLGEQRTLRLLTPIWTLLTILCSL